MFGFSKFLGSRSVTLVETWSLFFVLEIAISLGIKYNEIETDSQKIFNLVQHTSYEFHPLPILISNCKHLLSWFENYKFLKIPRAKNTCADLLAKKTRERRTPMRSFTTPPPPPLFVQNAFAQGL